MSAGTDLIGVVNTLTRERKRQGRTQADVAASLDRAQSTLAGWEAGHSVPGIEALFCWAHSLGLSIKAVAPEVAA